MITQSLHWLLADYLLLPEHAEVIIHGLCSDSRQVKTNDLFIARKGLQQDARQFISQAIKLGATAVLAEGDSLQIDFSDAVPIITLPALPALIGPIAAKFYDYPSRQLTMIGITGTNGKTSTSHFIAHVYQQLGLACGIIGTLGNGFPDALQPSPFTTPDPIALQKTLYDFHKQGAKAIAMEVSSHSLQQSRVAAVEYDTAVFTNLSRDHLDYHGDMAAYAAAKSQLFQFASLYQAILNFDDDFSRSVLPLISNDVQITGYGLNSANRNLQFPWVTGHNIQCATNGLSCQIVSPWGEANLNVGLLGKFNISNVLAVLCVACNQGLPFDEVINALASIKTVPGRMQAFRKPGMPLTVVDYSHTPDALQRALVELRAHCSGKIWCVFGCGGDRDQGKRPIMGEIAEKQADFVIVTDDNPRSEDPEKIVAAIVTGISKQNNMVIEHNRALAIDHALNHAKPDDAILIAGKGHEDYQLVGQEKRHFSDLEYVAEKYK